MDVKETIIYIPKCNEVEVLRTLARFNKNTFAVRVLNSISLAKLLLISSGITLSGNIITSEAEAFTYKKILKERAKVYFTGDTISDAKNIRTAIDNARSLVLDDKIIFKSLENSPFTSKNIDLSNIYIEYKDYLSKNKLYDSITLIKEAINKAKSLDNINFICFNEFDITPLEECLINKASNNNVLRMSFKDYIDINSSKEEDLIVSKCHSEYVEVLNTLDYINKNNLNIDSCLVVLTNNSYQSILEDFSSNLGIPMTFSVGRPLMSSIAGRLLKSLLNWNTKGMNGITALQDVFRYLDTSKLKEAIAISDLKNSYGKDISDEALSQLIEYMGNLKISFDKDKNKEKLEDFSTAKFSTREKYTLYLPDLVNEFSNGYSYIIENYLTVNTFDEEAAKSKIIRLLNQYTFNDIEEYILEILPTSYSSSLQKPGALHVVMLDNALESLRENTFILGMSSDYFPGVSNESYVILDTEFNLINPNNKLTKLKKTEMKIKALSDLISTANKLNINLHMSYSGYSVSDVKEKNKAAAIYDYPEEERTIDYSTFSYFNRYMQAFVSGKEIKGKSFEHTVDPDFKVNAEDLFNDKNPLSPSALEAIYLEPSEYSFFLKNILGIYPIDEKNPLDFCDAAGFGNIIHESLEEFDKSSTTKQKLKDRGNDIFDNYALKHVGSDKESQRKRMEYMLANAYKMINGTHSKSELPLSGKVEGISFRGRVDRIERTEDGFAVVDFKTGKVKHKPNNPFSGVQGIIYSSLYNESENPGTANTIYFDYLKNKTIVLFSNDEETRKLLFTSFKDKVNNLDFDIEYLDYYKIIRKSNPKKKTAPRANLKNSKPKEEKPKGTRKKKGDL